MRPLEEPWYLRVFEAFLLEDVPETLEVHPSACVRDWKTIKDRVACEGESFVTKTLPALGKAFDLALQGRTPLSTEAFKKVKGTAYPVFLQVMLRRVFDPTGMVRDCPCTKTIRLLRQILFWCKKVEKGYSDESLRKAANDLFEVDSSLHHPDENLDDELLSVARGVIDSIFEGFKPKIKDLKPRHGPGSVAGARNSAVEKRMFKTAYARLERVFRPIPFFFSLRDAAFDHRCVTGRAKEEFGKSRVAFVNKDSGGPRVIGLEPSEYMWIQQALKRLLYTYIEGNKITKGQINFTDQTINRDLTRQWERFVTLDMSKASDRVSLALVRSLFRNQIRLLTWLEACRTPATVLPDKRVLTYRKFAPMGSAVCFPIEAMVFYALVVSSLVKQGMPIQLALRNTFVYGDDIIIPHGFFDVLNEDLQRYHLRFNPDKCCLYGKFRESCGSDMYDSVDVTPIRMKRVYAMDGPDSIPIVPLVRHANNLYAKGYPGAAKAFRRLFMETYPVIRAMSIPSSPYENLPVLAHLDYGSECEVEKFYLNSLTYVFGWVHQKEYHLVPRQLEGSCFRESLILGGPVGCLRKHPEWGTIRRYLDQRFPQILIHRGLIVCDGIFHQSEPVTKTGLIDQIEEMVKTQACTRQGLIERLATPAEEWRNVWLAAL